MKATDDPPSLSHIADKTTREWIFAWLKDPQAYAVDLDHAELQAER